MKNIKKHVNTESVDVIKKYVRAANYLSAIQIYLKNNFLLEKPLTFDDIKPRLLGHWGTCPGINFIYANLNYLIKKHSCSMMFILGPGHGFSALQSNLFLEGTLGEFYPKATQTESGIGYIAKNFCWPYGFPSHSSPCTPGVIVEGGELGYALSTAYGAVLDNPDLIAACIIGDGEAETGPTATAWHLSKFIDPKTNGTVLPILHLNGYKISGPTIFGRMSNRVLKSLFVGYGYEPIIVEGSNIYQKMIDALEYSYGRIQEIKSSQEISFKPFPMIVLKTPKGWTGIKRLHKEKIEGSHLSHQVVTSNAKTDTYELKALEKWLRSYQFEELFNEKDGFIKEISNLVPEGEWRMGKNKHTYGWKEYKNLNLPDEKEIAEDATVPGTIGSSSMRRLGLYLNKVFELNKENKNFRLFSPDETYSNKLDAVFQTTSRAFMLPIKSWDKDLSPDGRVMEMLSEHSLQGMSQGYVLTGRHAIFASYEAFIDIVSSMTAQYIKFLKVCEEIPWRKTISSLNYILTSSGWRQEHNGFSHQNPGFIDNMLKKKGCFIRAYFPPDGNSTLVVAKKCLESKNGINIIVAGKTLEPRWLTIEQAEKELERGLMIWDFASDPNPDIVFCAIGDYLTKEALAAIDYVKSILPEVRMRFVNIIELSAVGVGSHECAVPFYDFDTFFTKDKPVIFNYHGYPETIQSMLLYQKNTNRFCVNGYIENGSTTTPFDMMIVNRTSRYHLVIQALQILSKRGVIDGQKGKELTSVLQRKLECHRDHIKRYGVDPEEITSWTWGSLSKD